MKLSHKKIRAQIFNIQRFSIHDGPGIRTTIFFKGCNLRCFWCHNPESWMREPQLFVRMEQCIGCQKCFSVCPHRCHGFDDGGRYFKRDQCTACGLCAQACCTNALQLSGYCVTVDEMMAEITKDIPFYNNSKGGVTFSGGECMLQINFLEETLGACKKHGIHTAVDTAGNVDFANFERILPHTGLLLYDLKCVTDALHRQGTGASNTRILANLERLLDLCPGRVWIRIPVVPGFNADEDEFRRIAGFLHAHPRPAKVELLPYHSLGESKRKALGLKGNSDSLHPIGNKEIKIYRDIIRLEEINMEAEFENSEKSRGFWRGTGESRTGE